MFVYYDNCIYKCSKIEHDKLGYGLKITSLSIQI